MYAAFVSSSSWAAPCLTENLSSVSKWRIKNLISRANGQRSKASELSFFFFFVQSHFHKKCGLDACELLVVGSTANLFMSSNNNLNESISNLFIHIQLLNFGWKQNPSKYHNIAFYIKISKYRNIISKLAPNHLLLLIRPLDGFLITKNFSSNNYLIWTTAEQAFSLFRTNRFYFIFCFCYYLWLMTKWDISTLRRFMFLIKHPIIVQKCSVWHLFYPKLDVDDA